MSAELVDPHRYTPTSCWYCGKSLGSVFTSVRKRGIDHRVHPTCRPEALTVVVEDNEDTFNMPAFLPEIPIG